MEVKYTIYGEKCQQYSLNIFFHLNIIENKIWTSDLNCDIYFQSLELNQTSLESSLRV